MNTSVIESKNLSFEDLKLPAGGKLFIQTGIEGNYKSLTKSTDNQEESDWIYFPKEKFSFWDEDIANNIELSKSKPMPFEDNWIHPLIYDNKVISLLVSTKKKISSDYYEQIINVFEEYENEKNNLFDNESELTTELVSALYSYDSDIETFTKRFLKLIVEECDQCCAGLYYFDGISYNLRFALGDLDRIDLLRRQPSQELIESWEKSIEKESFFVPAELLPNDVSFLKKPIEYYFVHPGIKSRTRKYLICMAMDADTSERFANKILRLAVFYSKLDEKQFIKSSSVLNLYEELLDTPGETREIEQILTRIYKLLSIQADISEIKWIDQNNDSWTISYNKDNQSINVLSESVDSIDQFDNILDGQNEILIDSSDSSDSTSNLWYRLKLPGRHDGYLLFTSKNGSEILNNYRPLFNDVKLFLLNYYWLGWYPEKKSNLLGVNYENVNAGSALQRFDTIGKLVDGYYHNIYSLMSVIIGQSDILNNLLDSADSDKVSNGIKKINFAADEVTDKLKKLQTIYPRISDEFSNEISCKYFLKQLPTYIQGFLTRIKDIKGISLRVQVDISSRCDFKLKMSDVFDIVLPLIVGITEQAISSGAISFKLENDNNNQGLSINFNRAIIVHTEISKLIQQLFIYHDFNDDGFGGGEIIINDFSLKANNLDEEYYMIKIQKIDNNKSYKRS